MHRGGPGHPWEERRLRGGWRSVVAALLMVALAMAGGGLVLAHPHPDDDDGMVEAIIYYRGITVLIDGRAVADEPFIYEGRTWLPVRSVAEAMGLAVTYDAVTGTVALNPAGGDEQVPSGGGEPERVGHAPRPLPVLLQPNAGQIVVAGHTLAYRPLQYEGRTWLPVRHVAEALGLQVAWDEATSRVLLTSAERAERLRRAWGMVGAALARAGVRMQRALLAEPTGMLIAELGAADRQRMAAGLGAAAAELDVAAAEVKNVLAREPRAEEAGPPIVGLLSNLAEDLSLAAEGLQARQSEMAAAGVDAFSERVLHLARSLSGKARDRLASAGQAADDAALYLGELGGGGPVASLFAAAARVLVEGDLAETQATAAALLSWQDLGADAEPNLYRALRLGDPALRAGLQLLAARPHQPAVLAWAQLVAAEPGTWTQMLMYAAAPAALYQVGLDLAAAGIEMLAIPYTTGLNLALFGLLDCPNECPEVCQNRNCRQTDWGIGTDRASPADIQRAFRALDWVNSTGRGGTSVPGLSDVVSQSAKALVGVVSAHRPGIWVQVGWEHCESVSCWVFWSRRIWVEHSQWGKVEAPADEGAWPAVREWRPGSRIVQKIEQAMADKVRAMCNAL